MLHSILKSFLACRNSTVQNIDDSVFIDRENYSKEKSMVIVREKADVERKTLGKLERNQLDLNDCAETTLSLT